MVVGVFIGFVLWVFVYIVLGVVIGDCLLLLVFCVIVVWCVIVIIGVFVV